MGLGKIWLEGERLLITCHGLVKFALLSQDDAQVVVGLGDAGPQPENLVIGRRCLGKPPRKMFAPCKGHESVQFVWLS